MRSLSLRLAAVMAGVLALGLALVYVAYEGLQRAAIATQALAEARAVAQGVAAGWGRAAAASDGDEPRPAADDPSLAELGRSLHPGGVAWLERRGDQVLVEPLGPSPAGGWGRPGEGWEAWASTAVRNGAEELALATAPVGGVPWAEATRGFAVALPLARFRAPASHARDLLLLVSALVGLGAIATGTFLLRWLAVRPIRRLTARMQRLDLGASPGTSATRPAIAPMHPDDDIANLGAAFDDLVARLREYELSRERAIVEQREALRRLEEAQEQLVRSEKLAAVGILTAGIAHEVGNPINIVLGYIDLLAEPALSEEQRREYLGHLRIAADRVSHIIHDLLAFSRPGPEREEPALASARATVDQCLRLLEPQARFRRVQVQVSAPAGDVLVAISPRRLEQVLVNLLLNAADAMGGQGRVEVRISTRGSQGLIEVSDEGPGMDASTLARVFDPFFSTKGPGKGTGLGLSISQRIAAAFGGAVDVESALGRGATFRVALPLAT